MNREMPPEALGAFLQFPVQIGRDILQNNGRHFETVTVPISVLTATGRIRLLFDD